MRYALDKNNEKIEVEYSGQRALCPGCKKEVTGKIYKEKKNHWAHLVSDCDKWYEPISDWHLRWQNYFPKENREVTLFDENNEEFHRADVLLDNGAVIEVQNSPINIKEVAQREKFYNKNGLIWILNAENLIPKASFVNTLIPEKCEVKITFYAPPYFDFTTDVIINGLKEKGYHRLDHSCGKIVLPDSIEYIFQSSSIANPEGETQLLASSIESLNWKHSRSNYGREPKPFGVEIKITSNKYRLFKDLYRAQWRSFIDEMKAPVFLDNVADLDPDYLYWVQKRKLIKKEIILQKSLENTKTKGS